MKEVFGNIWTYPADIRFITTNGTVKRDGTCVMGRGVALQAKRKFPGIDRNLGEILKAVGNKVFLIWTEPMIFSFPVKHVWNEKADLDLIEQSAISLRKLSRLYQSRTLLITRPGCGNGQRDWETEVKPILLKVDLPDNVHIIELVGRK